VSVRFYGYKHWTLEDIPRCYYVGKGLIGRANSNRHRNHKWHAIVKRLGLRVEVCVGPVTNEEACAWEVENISKEGTFSTNHSHDVGDIGCNFTKGGEGTTGRKSSPETRAKISSSKTGVANPILSKILRGRPLSEEYRQRIRDGLACSEHREAANEARSKKLKGRVPFNKGRRLSLKHSQAIGNALRGNHNTRGKTIEHLRCGQCGRLGHTRKTCEET
jgi:hypothetical protein